MSHGTCTSCGGNTCSKCGTSYGTALCGCKDTPLTTIPTFECPPGVCPVPPVCDEIFSANCVTYQGASIVDLPVYQGMSVEAITQMLILYLTNPAAVTGVCKSTFNVFPTEVGTTYITLGWDASPTANRYQVQYKLASSGVYLALPEQTTQVAHIPSLLANTNYNVRIKTICSAPLAPEVSTFSVVLNIKTN